MMFPYGVRGVCSAGLGFVEGGARFGSCGIRYCGKYGNRPLHIACLFGHQSCVQVWWKSHSGSFLQLVQDSVLHWHILLKCRVI